MIVISFVLCFCNTVYTYSHANKSLLLLLSQWSLIVARVKVEPESSQFLLFDVFGSFVFKLLCENNAPEAQKEQDLTMQGVCKTRNAPEHSRNTPEHQNFFNTDNKKCKIKNKLNKNLN